MCVIVYKRKNVSFDISILNKIIQTNPDGLGVSVRQRSGLWLTTRYNPDKQLTDRQKNKLINSLKGRDAVIHARIATSGGVNRDNVQPFINSKYTLFHNGIISSINGVLNNYSDTRLLSVLIESFTPEQVGELLSNLAIQTRSVFVLIENNSGAVSWFGSSQDLNGLTCSNLNFNRVYSCGYNWDRDRSYWYDDDGDPYVANVAKYYKTASATKKQ